MNDLISRQAVLSLPRDTTRNFFGEIVEESINVADIERLPSAEPEEIALHESCTDCPLYDKDKHSCPRFNKVIPETLREVMAERRQDASNDSN